EGLDVLCAVDEKADQFGKRGGIAGRPEAAFASFRFGRLRYGRSTQLGFRPNRPLRLGLRGLLGHPQERSLWLGGKGREVARVQQRQLARIRASCAVAAKEKVADRLELFDDLLILFF